MKKLFRNKKALSPVVAAIILIAVTVAVSIAVAAWMGALTFTFMGTEELKITNVEFLSGNHVNITLQNTGTSPITVNEIYISGSTNLLSSSITLSANSRQEVQVDYSWQSGYSYEIKVVTSKGNQFYYTATAPSS